MSIVSWVVMGLVVGLLAGVVASGYGFMEDMIVAVVGSIIAGWIFLALTNSPVTLLSLPDTLAALVGAVVFVAITRELTRGRSTI